MCSISSWLFQVGSTHQARRLQRIQSSAAKQGRSRDARINQTASNIGRQFAAGGMSRANAPGARKFSRFGSVSAAKTGVARGGGGGSLEDAQALLDRVATTVEPLMKRHSWFVEKLQEMMPRKEGLLGMNVNRGAKILLKLRQGGGFMPFEQILDTMLHELVHMEIGPHNASFYKMWDELRSECERDFVSGAFTVANRGSNSDDATSQVVPFSGKGQRVGSATGRRAGASMLDRRAAAMAAAERRRGVGGRRLGGGSGGGCGGDKRGDADDGEALHGLSAKERALRAAERRRQQQSTCIAIADGQDQDVALDDDPDLQVVEKPPSTTGVASASTSSSTFDRKTPLPVSTSSQALFPADQSWSCPTCTFVNCREGTASRRCSACGATPGAEVSFWRCVLCGLEISDKHERCLCGRPRKREPDVVDLT